MKTKLKKYTVTLNDNDMVGLTQEYDVVEEIIDTIVAKARKQGFKLAEAQKRVNKYWEEQE